MKKWIIILNIVLSSIAIVLLVDLASFDRMENHLTGGGLVVSRPMPYAIFGTIALLISIVVSIHFLFFYKKTSKGIELQFS